MTKSEVRSVILSKMAPPRDAVIYDVGAGTGSVSVQLAKKAIDGMVYAVEKNAEGLALIYKNKIRFHVSNIRPVHGEAPEALRDLPAPDLAFIGGSGGNLRQILGDSLGEKSPGQSCDLSYHDQHSAECMACMQAFAEHPAQILQVQVARGKKAGILPDDGGTESGLYYHI